MADETVLARATFQKNKTDLDDPDEWTWDEVRESSCREQDDKEEFAAHPRAEMNPLMYKPSQFAWFRKLVEEQERLTQSQEQ
jgi:hypothetical protein